MVAQDRARIIILGRTLVRQGLGYSGMKIGAQERLLYHPTACVGSDELISRKLWSELRSSATTVALTCEGSI